MCLTRRLGPPQRKVEKALAGERKITDIDTLVGVLDKEAIRHGGNREKKSYKRLKHQRLREEIREFMYGVRNDSGGRGHHYKKRPEMLKKDGVFDLIAIDAYFTRR